MDPRWIDMNDRKPLPATKVLVLLDYTEYRRDKRVEIAHVYSTAEPMRYGGPNSVTGQGWLTGLYFAIPSIVAPGIVSHWMELPDVE